MSDKTIKTLETLERLASKKVEEKQIEIAEVLRVVEQMKERRAELITSVEKETSLAQKNGDIQLMQMAGNYSLRAKAELQDIAEATEDANKILTEKRSDLQERFSEQKRYEILLRRKKEERLKEIRKKEQNALDEVAQTLSS